MCEATFSGGKIKEGDDYKLSAPVGQNCWNKITRFAEENPDMVDEVEYEE